MIGLGTMLNAAGILLGGILGLLCGKRIAPRFQESLMQACGVSVIFLGITGAMEHMLQISQGEITSGGVMLVVISLSLGALIGEGLNIEHHIEHLGSWLKKKTNSTQDQNFTDGFVTASLTVCVGAMAIVGAIEDGISHDCSILLAKGFLDAIIIMIMTASQNSKGCIFSVVPVVLFQGSITLFAAFVERFITPNALDCISLVGAILIFCVGVNLVFGKKVKVANLLPSVLIAYGLSFLMQA